MFIRYAAPPFFLVPQISGELEGGVRPIDSHLLWNAYRARHSKCESMRRDAAAAMAKYLRVTLDSISVKQCTSESDHDFPSCAPLDVDLRSACGHTATASLSGPQDSCSSSAKWRKRVIFPAHADNKHTMEPGVDLHSACGHTAKARPVKKEGGRREGWFQVRISGPTITGKSGVKCVYSQSAADAAAAMAKYLRVTLDSISVKQCTSESDHDFPSCAPLDVDLRSACGHTATASLSGPQDSCSSSVKCLTAESASAASAQVRMVQFLGVSGDSNSANVLSESVATPLGKRKISDVLDTPDSVAKSQAAMVGETTCAPSYPAPCKSRIGLSLTVNGQERCAVVKTQQNRQIPHVATASALPQGVPTEEQQAVIDLVVSQRRTCFLSGEAGTGKSFVLKHIEHGPPFFLVPQISGELEGGVRPIGSHLLWHAYRARHSKCESMGRTPPSSSPGIWGTKKMGAPR